MPLTEKGEKIKKAMSEQYGKERGEQIFYSSKNKGTISGVDNMNTFTTSTKGTGDNMSSSAIGTSGIGSTGGTPSSTIITGDVGGSSTVGGKTTGYNISTDTDDDENSLVLDADLTPERQDELEGDIPKSKAQEPKDKSTLPDTVRPAPTMTASLVPLSIPVGDQSLSNMNSRNRNFWKR